MKTLIIEVKNEQALHLIEDLEALDLVKIVKEKVKISAKTSVSKLLSGSISEEQAVAMRAELNQTREEWERGI